MRRSYTIRQEIIGRSMAIGARRIWRGGSVRGEHGAFALLHQPSSQVGRGIFRHPLVEKRGDLFAEIGGMAEPRKLVGLQGIAGSSEKKFPRGLGDVVAQEFLRSNVYESVMCTLS